MQMGPNMLWADMSVTMKSLEHCSSASLATTYSVVCVLKHEISVVLTHTRNVLI